ILTCLCPLGYAIFNLHFALNIQKKQTWFTEYLPTIRNIPVEVSISDKDGLPKKCVVNLDTITTIRKVILRERICSLKAEKIKEIQSAIKFALALE
ncbi:MAG: type II toxin-antitoxin system PemK/MazF family toxin, partial [Candidatus Omnitrophica bacterium]|nr:type II toxin-antitoxin system PemK/MazF family toxin [Candidatus Omnitrophota bacterium]